jgi:hypothetical protein
VFTSRIVDAGDARVTGISFEPTNSTPAGTAIAYETRTAANKDDLATAADLQSSPWAPLRADGTVASPAAQYLQYRAALSTTAPPLTPSLDKVKLGFTVDDQAPVVTIGDVAVSGAAAKVTFNSDDGAAGLECKLDGAGSQACTSPTTFTGLASGSHTIVVKATDTHGNVGSATRAFDVAPPSGTGPTPAPPSGTGPTPPSSRDVIAPNVTIISRSVRVSNSGIAKVRVTCPATETRCTVTVKLKLTGRTAAARGTTTISGGSTRTVALRLSRATRSALAAHSHVKVTAVVTATDAAANHRTTQVRMTLRAASR